MHASPSTPPYKRIILTNQSKLTTKSSVTNFISCFFLISWHTFRLESNMVYLSENGKALIQISLLELDKHTYLMLQAKYKDKLKTITEYYTLKRVIT